MGRSGGTGGMGAVRISVMSFAVCCGPVKTSPVVERNTTAL